MPERSARGHRSRTRGCIGGAGAGEADGMTKQTGIPKIERFVGKMLIGRWCRQHPPGETMSIVRSQRDEFASLLAAHSGKAEQRVQIRRMPGLEASSTNYSLAMTVEHCARVNRSLAALLDDLAADRAHRVVVATKDYKPSADATAAGAMEELDASIQLLGVSLSDAAVLERSGMRHEHPWFGPLSARVWACFPAFHQAIHVKQARAIAAGL